jgi:hypothetical protein
LRGKDLKNLEGKSVSLHRAFRYERIDVSVTIPARLMDRSQSALNTYTKQVIYAAKQAATRTKRNLCGLATLIKGMVLETMLLGLYRRPR